ncbi:PREDICTED: uncharacterized protein LOC108966477 [Bactrocera latifrons]|uniref:uncharacterized protein LOC108966477 n=1 Tax=Bactrocera latifrons TaxID=174628 RepID=UPI0008DD188A|nr:PREDICTED: uncharacterized protein LOC108966477 [Bactrocera latifrons]
MYGYIKFRFATLLDTENILSGATQVLLDMLQTAQWEPNFKRLHCYLKVLFIDDYEAYKFTCEISDYKLYHFIVGVAHLFRAIALGQGNNVAYDVAFKGDRLINGTKIIRPIKDLSETETLLYIRARNASFRGYQLSID